MVELRVVTVSKPVPGTEKRENFFAIGTTCSPVAVAQNIAELKMQYPHRQFKSIGSAPNLQRTQQDQNEQQIVMIKKDDPRNSTEIYREEKAAEDALAALNGVWGGVGTGVLPPERQGPALSEPPSARQQGRKPGQGSTGPILGR